MTSVGIGPIRQGKPIIEVNMVLITVDGRIAEAVEMFEGHVPVRYRELALREEADEKELFSSGTATRRPKPWAQRGCRQASLNVQRQSFQVFGDGA